MLNTLFKAAVIAPVAAVFVPAPGASPVNAAQKHYEQERGKKKSARQHSRQNKLKRAQRRSVRYNFGTWKRDIT